MALTVVPVHQAEVDLADISTALVKPVVIQFDSSYPLGGYPLTPSTFGFTRKIFGILFSAGATARIGGYQIGQDPLSGTIRLFVATTVVTGSAGGWGGNAQRATDLSAWSEVASTTNLSGIRIRALAVGY